MFLNIEQNIEPGLSRRHENQTYHVDLITDLDCTARFSEFLLTDLFVYKARYFVARAYF